MARLFTAQVKGKVPDTSFLNDRSSAIRLNTRLRNVCVSKMVSEISPVVASDQYVDKTFVPQHLASIAEHY